MKKVFIYINQICLRGGVEKVFYNLINNLDKDKYDITVLTTVAYLSDDLKVDIYKGRIKRFFFYYDEFSDNFFVRQYQRAYNKIANKFIDGYIKSKKWDVAIAAQEGIYAKYIENLKSDKKLLWIHNDMNMINPKCFKTLEDEKQCYLKFDNVVCVSEDVKNSMISKFGYMNNLCVKYNPIDTNEIDLLKNETVTEHRIGLDIPLFVSVGRLCNQKGYDRILRIVKQLNEQNYKFEIWIVGDGPDRKELEDYISMNNLINVKLLGYRSNPFAYINFADWILCSSRFEGFNTVLQEAVYIGKPVITTNCAGSFELFGNNEYGIITENNEDSLYNGIMNILNNQNIHVDYIEKVKHRKSFVSLNERISKIEELL